MVSQGPNEGTSPDRSQQLLRAARDRLKSSPYCPLRSVSCECRQGALVLRGTLPTFYQKQLAQEAVAKLEGVTEVVNETVVASSYV